MSALLAWTPFFDPMNYFLQWWFLLALPLSVFISMTYKALRVKRFTAYWRHVAIMSIQMLLGMALLHAGVLVLIEWIMPLLPVE